MMREIYSPTESLLLLVPELLAARIVTDMLFGRENCPLDGRLKRFSFSTSDRNGLFGVNSCRNSKTGVPFGVEPFSVSAVYHCVALPTLIGDAILSALLDLRFSFGVFVDFL